MRKVSFIRDTVGRFYIYFPLSVLLEIQACLALIITKDIIVEDKSYSHIDLSCSNDCAKSKHLLNF